MEAKEWLEGDKAMGGLRFFTPFAPEAPHHILLYVVRRCTKGVVRLTYEWCHVIIPLLCCNELYSWWTVTPRVSLCPVLMSTHWAWPRATAFQVEFGELVYIACTLGASPRGSHKKWDRAVDPKGNFWGCKKWPLKTKWPIPSKIFECYILMTFLAILHTLMVRDYYTLDQIIVESRRSEPSREWTADWQKRSKPR